VGGDWGAREAQPPRVLVKRANTRARTAKRVKFTDPFPVGWS